VNRFPWQNYSDDRLLKVRLKDLGVTIEGTWLEGCVAKLYEELDARALVLKPHVWLSDEWFSPGGVPGFAVPFYLAHPRLRRLERNQILDVEGASRTECMRIMRHETGHAIQHGYQLHRRRKWQELFGKSSTKYPEYYRPNPSSKRYVQHLRLWYAQAHPDEDFAETFAVWLTPRSGWRAKYRGWSAMAKLRYVDRIARRVGEVDPPRAIGATDVTVDQMETTIGEFYRQARESDETLAGRLPLDVDLKEIFSKAARRRRPTARPAADLVAESRKAIVDRVTYWTGVRRPLVKSVVDSIERRLRELGLWTEPARERGDIAAVTAYVTTLAMNYLVRGEFIASEEE
jgi:hypothetical protein